MNGADALILTGAPGTGKSTVAAILGGRAERGVHLESDAFFRFISRGYVEPSRPESHDQNQVVMRIVAEAAAGYALAGYFTVVDGVVIPRFFLDPMCEVMERAGLRVAYAVLRAPLEECVRRVDEREGGPLADPEAISRLWSEFADLGELEPHAVDVADLEPERAADAVVAQLADGSLFP